MLLQWLSGRHAVDHMISTNHGGRTLGASSLRDTSRRHSAARAGPQPTLRDDWAVEEDIRTVAITTAELGKSVTAFTDAYTAVDAPDATPVEAIRAWHNEDLGRHA